MISLIIRVIKLENARMQQRHYVSLFHLLFFVFYGFGYWTGKPAVRVCLIMIYQKHCYASVKNRKDDSKSFSIIGKQKTAGLIVFSVCCFLFIVSSCRESN